MFATAEAKLRQLSQLAEGCSADGPSTVILLLARELFDRHEVLEIADFRCWIWPLDGIVNKKLPLHLASMGSVIDLLLFGFRPSLSVSWHVGAGNQNRVLCKSS